MRRCIGKPRQLLLRTRLLGFYGRELRSCRINGSCQLRTARFEAALGKCRLLSLTLEAALLLTCLVQPTLCLHDAFIELRVPLLSVGQLHVELFKTRLCRDSTLLDLLELLINFREIGCNLVASGTGLFGQL